MKITICDDEMREVKNTKELLDQYLLTKPGLSATVEVSQNSSKLYDDINAGEESDIYILDVMMPGRSGIEIGKLLDEQKRKCVVIYTTCSKDYALDAYGVKASRYLLKPIEENAFCEAMDFAILHVQQKLSPEFIVKTKQGVVTLDFDKIIYIESASRAMHFHMSDGSLIRSIMLRASFETELDPILKDENFIQIHKSFVINMAYISNMSQESVTLGNVILPISKKKIAQTKKTYLAYIADRYR